MKEFPVKTRYRSFAHRNGHLMFASVESFQASFGPHAQEINDIPNYTNLEPTVQISELTLRSSG